jgi:hypothetical protein
MKLLDRLKKAAESRPTKRVPIKEILDGYEGGDAIGFRALTIGEETDAEVAAVRAKKEALAGFPEWVVSALAEGGFFTAQHACERLARACRDPEHPELPAFESAEAMMEVLYPEDVATMGRILSECADVKRAPLPTADLDDLLARIAATDGEWPTVDIVLASFPRGTLQDALIRASKRLAASDNYQHIKAALEGQATN